MPALERRKSSPPIYAPRAASRCDTVGCVLNSRAAAELTVPESSTATNASIAFGEDMHMTNSQDGVFPWTRSNSAP